MRHQLRAAVSPGAADIHTPDPKVSIKWLAVCELSIFCCCMILDMLHLAFTTSFCFDDLWHTICFQKQLSGTQYSKGRTTSIYPLFIMSIFKMYSKHIILKLSETLNLVGK